MLNYSVQAANLFWLLPLQMSVCNAKLAMQTQRSAATIGLRFILCVSNIKNNKTIVQFSNTTSSSTISTTILSTVPSMQLKNSLTNNVSNTSTSAVTSIVSPTAISATI